MNEWIAIHSHAGYCSGGHEIANHKDMGLGWPPKVMNTR